MALPKQSKTRSWNRSAAREAMVEAELEGWEAGDEDNPEGASPETRGESREP